MFVLLLFLICPFVLHAQDGDLDPTFGDGGTLRIDAGPFVSDEVNAVVVRHDDIIVSVGTSVSQGKQGMRFMSLDSTGTIDTSTFFVNETSRDTLTGLAVQPDNKVVAVGFSEQQHDMISSFSFIVVRYTTDGELDETFNPNGAHPGIKIVDFNVAISRAYAVAFKRDGRIVVVGESQDANSLSEEVFYAVAVLHPDGSLDNSFASAGRKVFGVDEIPSDINAASSARAVAMQSIDEDDNIVLAGFGQQGTNGLSERHFQVVRITCDGQLDSTFGQNQDGVAEVTFADDTDEQANGVDVLPDGSIVAIGTSGDPTATQHIVATRLHSNGLIDTSFGNAMPTDGKCIYVYDPAALLTGNALVIQNDLKTVIVGGFDNEDDQQTFIVVRLTADGMPDSTFGSDATNPGSVLTSFGDDTVAVGTAIAMQQDGKLVVAGNANVEGQSVDTFSFARYMNDNSSAQVFVLPTIDTPANVGNCNQPQPLFSGIAQNPSNITLFINGLEAGRTITTGAQNVWSFTPALPLDPGRIAVQMVAEYKSGNMNVISEPICCGVCLGPQACVSQAVREKYCPCAIE